ncbi:hypothetical protein CHLNCDRAFT_52154 [Chlorella variabilis]|uniref:Progestin and adipoQ receptor family member 4 n=1 Tax=Chlorella variabilis TaxID=554065 RepID=E1ZDN9_CHLVA|nr:hypothetical protein CHLNCDRAFT_52154 [Chlorella variabilis]EFN56054.1 hypothetical protein CHLNCDRAFT_52154 [Chlorella variabilis]|eukprot:XP_005848156.1 hypothetical protein CHLNCDRAFT_52154 [Chlorella variabilis]
MAVGQGSEGWPAGNPKQAAPSQALEGSKGGPPATAASAAQAVAAALLAPKRQKKKGSMSRVSTLSAFSIECTCRVSKAGGLVRAASAPAAGEGEGAPTVRCSYYDAAAEGRPAGRQHQLYSFLDAPEALRFNKFIRSGYRAGLSYPQCCRSMLSLHNETGNIWTHLLPALLLVVLVLGGQLQAWQGARLAFAANVGSIAACFLGSVLYHTCMANHHQHDHWLKLDVCGILLVLVGGGHMVLWWGLYCHPAARATFALLYYGCAAGCVWAALRARTAAGRGLPMLALLLVRISAFAARLLLEPPSVALQHYAAMEVCSLAGGLLNVLRIPERWLQPEDPTTAAPLDFFLNSHQIMHVLVAAAMWQLHLGAAADYRTVSALLDGSMQCPS